MKKIYKILLSLTWGLTDPTLDPRQVRFVFRATSNSWRSVYCRRVFLAQEAQEAREHASARHIPDVSSDAYASQDDSTASSTSAGPAIATRSTSAYTSVVQTDSGQVLDSLRLPMKQKARSAVASRDERSAAAAGRHACREAECTKEDQIATQAAMGRGMGMMAGGGRGPARNQAQAHRRHDGRRYGA